MLVGSILIGALAGFALLNYVQGVEEDVQNQVARVDVFMIAGEVSKGTTASDVRISNRIVEKKIESSFRPATAITDLAQIQGRVAVSDLAANQVLVAGMFENPETVETSYVDLIDEEHIAIALSIDSENAVHGFVKAGDFVDIIAVDPINVVVGEEDAFETSAGGLPYDNTARFLYRGVRVTSVGNDVDGQAAPLTPGTDAPAASDSPESEGTLKITVTVPPDAVQRILSVSEESIRLALHPKSWDPVSQGNVVLDEILIDADLPGEDAGVITPDGPEGYINNLAEAVEADDAAAAAEPATTSGDGE